MNFLTRLRSNKNRAPERAPAYDDIEIIKSRASFIDGEENKANDEKNKKNDESKLSVKSLNFGPDSFKIISDTEIAELMHSEMAILTADPKSPLYRSESDRNNIIIYEDGTFIVSKGNFANAHVSEIIQIAEDAKIYLKHRQMAEMSQIKRLYAVLTSEEGGENSVEYQKKLYELIQKAARQKSSDIHIKLLDTVASIHFTIRGEYTKQYDESFEDGEQIMNAAFNACTTGDKQFRPNRPTSTRLTTSEKFTLPDGVQYLRLEFTPLDNDKRGLTMRIAYVDTDTEIRDIDSLGYETFQVKNMNIMRRQSTGVIFISGPTGSGKSTTLKVALEKTGQDRKWKVKIVTIEDPPEFPIKNSWQMPIESGDSPQLKQEAFTRAMGSMLRMAPHIGMVGEVRDAIGARLTYEMAKTGHLVWGTVHANSAPEIITRVKGFNIDLNDLRDVNLMRGLIAQRLLKKVCPHCSYNFNDVLKGKVKDKAGKKVEAEEHIVEWFSKIPEKIRQRVKMVNTYGCDECNKNGQSNEGYAGRTLVAEVIVPNREFLEGMIEGEHEQAKKAWFKQPNSSSMLEHAFIRCLRGEIDPHDMNLAGDITLSDLQDENFKRMTEILKIYNFNPLE